MEVGRAGRKEQTCVGKYGHGDRWQAQALRAQPCLGLVERGPVLREGPSRHRSQPWPPIDSPEPVLWGHLLLRGADTAPSGWGQRLQDIWKEPARDREPSEPPPLLPQPLHPSILSMLHVSRFQKLLQRMSPITYLSPLWTPDMGKYDPLASTPPSLPSPFPLSPVSSSRKARQSLAFRGSRTQLPALAAHSSRRLCPARPSSMPLRSCRGTASIGCSQLAGGPLWRVRGRMGEKVRPTRGPDSSLATTLLTHLVSPVTLNM